MWRETGKTLLYYWWRLFYFGIAAAIVVLFWVGGHAWGLPFLLGGILTGLGYQIVHRITYGRWFE